MFSSIIKLLRKRRVLKNTEYSTDDSCFLFGPNVEVNVSSNANIKLGGKLLLGLSLTGTTPGYAHNCNTVLTMDKNSKLITRGDVQIAPGCTIRIGENGILELGGKNVIAHNTTIVASKKIIIGSGASISWGVNLIDDDDHSFYDANGKKIKRIRKPLIIGSNVGIQMNVSIPSGGNIGNNSIIAANTVIRKDVPANSLVYMTNEIKVINNITTGFQFQ